MLKWLTRWMERRRVEREMTVLDHFRRLLS